jgi:putative tryptophan/tyrosine transport system substrate-binding protein
MAAKTLGLELTVASAGAEDAIDKAFATLVREQAGAVLIGADPLFAAHRERIALLAERHTLPTIFITRDFAKVGGLMSYGPDQTDAYRQTGAYAGRILPSCALPEFFRILVVMFQREVRDFFQVLRFRFHVR